MGLFDKFKNKKEDIKTSNSQNNGLTLGFCTCGNLTDSKYCDVCSKFISNSKKFSQEEFDQILHDKIILPLSDKYAVNFEEISLKDYFNLEENEESHILYRLMRAIVFEEYGDISVFFEKILEETKNINDVEETIMNNIKSEIIEEFNNNGYTYNILLTTTSSGFKTVENSLIQNKHGTGTKVLATVLAGPLGFVATSGIKQTTESKQVYVEGEYLHNQYSFSHDYITIKSYSDNRNFNSFEPNGDVDKIVIDWSNIKHFDDEYSLILKSDKVIQLIPPNISDITNKNIFNIIGVNDWLMNRELHSKYEDTINSKTSILFIDLLNQYIGENNHLSDIQESNDNSINDLEKIVSMYEKGLLTDDEFIKMKNKLINE